MKKKDISILLKYWLPAIIIFIWLTYFFIMPIFIGLPSSPGEYGEMFGPLNTLFSGLAFVGLLIAIAYQRLELKLQRKELTLQRIELAQTNKELTKQRKQLEIQSSTLKRENFESTFFRLLELHNSILESITFIEQNGRNGISQIFGEINKSLASSLKISNYITTYLAEFNSKYNREPNNNERIEIELISYKRVIDEILEQYIPYVGHYFRNLYHIVKYIHESFDSEEEKYKYIRILRAQLSNHELCLLCYNCLTTRGEKFRELVVNYKLLKNMDEKNLNNRDILKFYSK